MKVFNALDTSQTGYVFVYEILKNCNFAYHPGVTGGLVTADDAREDMLLSFKNGHRVDGGVTWREFVDYYKGISLAIADDEHFLFVLGQTWSL